MGCSSAVSNAPTSASAPAAGPPRSLCCGKGCRGSGDSWGPRIRGRLGSEPGRCDRPVDRTARTWRRGDFHAGTSCCAWTTCSCSPSQSQLAAAVVHRVGRSWVGGASGQSGPSEWSGMVGVYAGFAALAGPPEDCACWDSSFVVLIDGAARDAGSESTLSELSADDGVAKAVG
jgi:hypothetical protein